MSEPFDHVWVTQYDGPVKVKDMTRSHIHNCLQWVLRRQRNTVLGTDCSNTSNTWAATFKDKDGLYYSEWISIFVARLLDPTLGP